MRRPRIRYDAGEASAGTMVVVGTGGTKEPFRAIADPMGFRRAVNEATEALRARAGAAAAPAVPG